MRTINCSKKVGPIWAHLTAGNGSASARFHVRPYGREFSAVCYLTGINLSDFVPYIWKGEGLLGLTFGPLSVGFEDPKIVDCDW